MGYVELRRWKWQKYEENCVILFIICTLHRIFSRGATSPSGPRPPHCRGFTSTLRHTTVGRTPMDKWSARRRDPYQTTRNTFTRKTRMTTAGCERKILASQRPQTHDLDRAATGTETWQNIRKNSSRMIGVGHVARVAEMRNTLKCLVRKSEGIRQIGRFRRRWTMTLK